MAFSFAFKTDSINIFPAIYGSTTNFPVFFPVTARFQWT